ncbi:MAG: 23S rRNA (adenine(2503)-C(2))-methyltransferase RlmN [Lachnospiraceae bacterium]|nr:23S rRNA (adenine(2503)-C(2))-methyltransferase RlmN [Lachnospiraceae bacterium]
MKKDIRALSRAEMEDLMKRLSFERFRADQVFDWLHGKLVSDFSEMKNVPGKLKEALSTEYEITPVKKELVQESSDGTRKYLFRMADDQMIESVLMRYEHGLSICVSSQAGCRMGCRFCASTIGGLCRNLAVGELLGQVYEVSKDGGERISNVVIMGTGEPLDNYRNVLTFIRLLNEERGLHISQRNITLSTCGLPEKIRALAKEELQITLAVSLHAATDEKRRKLMPVADSVSLKELMAVCHEYQDAGGRRLTFEYSLIAGFNDTDEDVRSLKALLSGLNAHVNLIPVNPVRERSFRPPDAGAVRAFQNKLEKNHINVTIRRELGQDIDGACGQLRRSFKTAEGVCCAEDLCKNRYRQKKEHESGQPVFQ